MNLWHALRRALDRLTLYLPLMVMGLLAMASWWLVRSMPDVWAEGGSPTQRKEPDYHLERFSTQVFDAQGHSLRSLSGDSARHYPHSDELHIEGVRFLAHNAQGVPVSASAQRGIASEGGDRVLLLGQVLIERPAQGQNPSLKVQAQQMLALQKQEKLLSDQAVQVWRDGDRFWAQGLDFDLKTGHYQLIGPVRMVLQPPAQP